jgi:branched-chain amino acid transport system ATP-binding protein
MELLRFFGLDGKAALAAKSLPYGERRRLEIARALATGPKVLLLDEPAAGMNPSEVEDLIRLIAEIRSQFDLSILLIEHQLKVVMSLCEYVSVMDFGQTISKGSPDEVIADPRVVEAYLGEEEGDDLGNAGA